jgi:hypothetical protein
MKMLEREIRDIIREELISVLEANPFHDKETGKLSSSKAGNVYSISEPASKMYGNEAKKGVVTASGKIQAKYGLPNECGRKSITGKEIEPKYSCSQFKKSYSNTRNEAREIATTDIQDVQVLDNESICLTLVDVIRFIEKERDRNKEELLEQEDSDKIKTTCKRYGYITQSEAFSNIVASLKQINAAMGVIKDK